MTIIKIYAKGQLVIPKKIRKILGLKPGQKVKLNLIDDHHIELTPLPDNPVEAFCGVFKDGSSLTNSLIKEHKEEKTTQILSSWLYCSKESRCIQNRTTLTS